MRSWLKTRILTSTLGGSKTVDTSHIIDAPIMQRRELLKTLLALIAAPFVGAAIPRDETLVSVGSLEDISSYVTQGECDEYVKGILRSEPISFPIFFSPHGHENFPFDGEYHEANANDLRAYHRNVLEWVQGRR
jgi:hypothetical protein